MLKLTFMAGVCRYATPKPLLIRSVAWHRPCKSVQYRSWLHWSQLIHRAV